MYKEIIRPLFFRFDPESVHHVTTKTLSAVCSLGAARGIVSRYFLRQDPRLHVQMCGLQFKNPVGLAAGFDKEGSALPFLSALGFGHIEVGTVTAKPQEGNPRPRIFRFPHEEALVNSMGFPSTGADRVAAHLRSACMSKGETIIGINIGKTKVTPLEEAASDYLYSFERLHEFADYVVLNVSSPNTPELRKLQEPDYLRTLLRIIDEGNVRRIPVFVKLAPDLEGNDLDQTLDVVMSGPVAGLIATNTTLSRIGVPAASELKGGLSGRPLTHRSREFVAAVYRRTEGKKPIIGVGGVFNATDALAMMRAGASLVQLYTGFIYEGPNIVATINDEILSFMNREGLTSLSSIVGMDIR